MIEVSVKYGNGQNKKIEKIIATMIKKACNEEPSYDKVKKICEIIDVLIEGIYVAKEYEKKDERITYNMEILETSDSIEYQFLREGMEPYHPTRHTLKWQV